jgi:hypothetical protein
MKKKALYGIGIVLLILIITNPTYKDFKEHIQPYEETDIFKESNLFICSFYDFSGDTYLGVLGNFFEFSSSSSYYPLSTEDSIKNVDRKIDSAKMADSAKMIMADTGYSSKDQRVLPPPPPKKIIGRTKDGLPVYEN